LTESDEILTTNSFRISEGACTEYEVCCQQQAKNMHERAWIPHTISPYRQTVQAVGMRPRISRYWVLILFNAFSFPSTIYKHG